MLSETGKAVARWVVEIENRAIVEANEEAQKMFGYTQRDMIGMDVLQLVPAEDVPLVQAAARENRWGDFGVWRCRRCDNSLFFAKFYWYQSDQHGRPCHYFYARVPTGEEIAQALLVRYRALPINSDRAGIERFLGSCASA